MSKEKKIRILIAKVGCDIHERGALTLLTTFRDEGMEAIYTGRYQTPKGVANAAVSEDVDVDSPERLITGTFPIIAEWVMAELKKLGVTDLPIYCRGLAHAERHQGSGKDWRDRNNFGTPADGNDSSAHIRSVAR
jgi:methylmalonyl-CoA mutase C-terminal domain/subunit